jgi:zinc transporter ZupT
MSGMQQDGLSTGVIVALGAGVGTALGVALHNMPSGLGIGIGLACVFAGMRAMLRMRRGSTK